MGRQLGVTGPYVVFLKNESRTKEKRSIFLKIVLTLGGYRSVEGRDEVSGSWKDTTQIV